MSKIKSIKDLHVILYERWSKLRELEAGGYLSEKGLAAMEAYKSAHWSTSFHDSLDTLRVDDEFIALIYKEKMHSEYYRILQVIFRAVGVDESKWR